MANVTRYEVLVYGDPNGYKGLRAQISLFDGLTHLGFIRFVDTGTAIPADHMTNGLIYMHEPITLLENILGILRNESSRVFYFINSHAFFGAEGS